MEARVTQVERETTEQALRRRLSALADELDRDADERRFKFDRLPDSPMYAFDRVQLAVAERHQRRASMRIRRLLAETGVG